MAQTELITGFKQISNADYHAWEGWSSSQIKLASTSPQRFWHAYINPDRPERTETESMAFGSLVHKVILEPDLFDSEYFTLPKGVALGDWGKTQKLAGKVQEAKAAGKLVIDQKRRDLAERMADAAREHPWIAEALKGGESEVSGFWTDARTGLLLKYRPDYRTPRYLVDYKTTIDSSPAGFVREIMKYGYHQSAAHYLDGEAALHADEPGEKPFIFIAQEKDPPYVAELFVLDQAFINLGRHENRRGLDVIATGLSTGDWPPRTGRGPAVLCPPSWARKMQ